MKPKTGLSAPWYTYQKKLAGLFAGDEAVTVGPVIQNDENSGAVSLEVAVRGSEKATAIRKLLPDSVTFGNVALAITVKEDTSEMTAADVIKAAFAYNPLFVGVEAVTDAMGVNHVYGVFHTAVIQFFNDDLSDYRGNFTALAADVVREIFEDTAYAGTLHFCTVDCEEESDD